MSPGNVLSQDIPSTFLCMHVHTHTHTHAYINSSTYTFIFNPMELTYHFYENNFSISIEMNTGVWNKTITFTGVVGYRCKVSNVVGTLYSPSVFMTVNGKRLVSLRKNVQQCFGVQFDSALDRHLTVHCDSQTRTYISLFINFLLFAKRI